jgi:hypothetical protein
MIQQGILPFKLEITGEEITPRSGLVLYAEVLRALKIRERVERYFPRPGSNRGYETWRFIEPLLMMLYGGGSHIEDIREIRDDRALRELLGLEKMPSLSTYGDWLVRQGKAGGLEAAGRINGHVVKQVCFRDKEEGYTLDVDATVIEAENLIKELKIGFGMEQMTSGVFSANALYFSLVVLVYDTTQAQKLLFMEKCWHKRTIATIRWKLMAPIEKLEIFLRIRAECLGFG